MRLEVIPASPQQSFIHLYQSDAGAFREQASSFNRLGGLPAPSTKLHADRPVFWELEVKLDLPGLDFEETYLVPVYGGD